MANHYGRYKLLTSLKPTGDIQYDAQIIPLILKQVLEKHQANVAEIENGRDYYFNHTEILNKTKTSREDVNNKVSKPICQIACWRKNAYCFGKPFQFISAEAEKQDAVQAFNSALKADNYKKHLNEFTLKSSWAALSYKFIDKPTKAEIENGMYFKSITDIDPTKAFCVYSDDITREKVLGVIFYDTQEITNKNGNIVTNTYTVYNVFTKWHKWRFKEENGAYSILPFTNVVVGDTLIDMNAFPYKLSLNAGNVVAEESVIPLLELERNPDRTNDFELAKSLIDAHNMIVSCAVDKIQQNVDYVLKLRDIDIGEWDENGKNPVYDRIMKYLESNILPIKSNEGATTQPDASVLDVPLDISQVKDLLTYIKQEIYESLFIPTRGQGVGQDTGKAVERRNGFTELEDFAGIVVGCAEAVEREFVQIALQIAKTIDGCPFKDLKPTDIDIKDVRNNIEDLQEQTQAFSTLVSAGTNRSTAYEITKLVADATDTAKLDETYAEKLRKEAEAQKQVENKTNNNVIDTTEKVVENKESTGL